MFRLIAFVCLLASSARSELSQSDLEKNVVITADAELFEVVGLPGPNETDPDPSVHHLFGSYACGSGQSSYSLPQTGSLPTMPAPRLSCRGYSLSTCTICVPSTPTYVTAGSTYNFRISVMCNGNKKNTYTTWNDYGSSVVSGSYSAYPQADFIGQVSGCSNSSSDYGWVRYEWCDDSSNYGSFIWQYKTSQCYPRCSMSYNTCGGSDGCGGTCNNCASGYTCNQYNQCVRNCQPYYGGSNTCGSDGCGGTYNNCTNGYTCTNGQCVSNCQPYYGGSNTCGSDGCGGTYNNCSNGYTCNNNGQCVRNCQPYSGYNTCGNDGCGGTYNNCTSGYTCTNGRCVQNCYASCANNTCVSDGCGGYCNCVTGYTCTNKKCVRNCQPYYGGSNTCGSDGCGGTYNNCSNGYTCNNGQCVRNCQPYYGGSNTCGSDGCGGTYNNCSNGYTCTNGQCVANCYTQCGSNYCGSDGCGGYCNNCSSGYTCTNRQCVRNCQPYYGGSNTCGSDGCGGTYNNCSSGYTCNNGQCVYNTPTYPACGNGYTGYYLPQTNDLPLPTDLGASNLYCTGSGTSACRICAPTYRVQIPTGQGYGSAPYSTNFTISVSCPGNKKNTYANWLSYGSASFSASYTAWPAADLLGRAYVSYSSDRGWVRYEWCDDQNKHGSWVTRWEGLPGPTASCYPSCGSRTCGNDGCGGSCGSCSRGYTCKANGTCGY